MTEIPKPMKATGTSACQTATSMAVLLVCVAWEPRVCVADCATSTCDICVESNETRNVTGSESANCVDIESGGFLDIQAGGTLTINGAGPSTIDGDIHLIDDTDGTSIATLAFTTNDHTVTGSGKIKGQDSLAVIDIDFSVTLTNDVKIVGALQITGAGNFVNDGQVTADMHSGTLDILVTGTIDDIASARWTVKNSSTATLRFNASACLNGAFTVSAGVLRAGKDSPLDDIDVVTTGDLTHTGGAIVAGTDDSFTFNGTCP